MSELMITGLHKRFGSIEVLKDINLTVASGEFTVFVGPSGCGKSTLLRLVCGLDEVSEGTITIDSEIVNDVPSSKRGIAMVFQSYALYPHMTVAENMGYALRLAKTPRAEIAERVRKAAEILKIESYLTRKPRQLSGGQRQRVAIGRAIVREPRIFLFDEPLSNLDAALRVDTRMEFARLKDRLGTTMIYVTHDQVEAMTLADKIVVMNAGRIEQVGAPMTLYREPVNRFVASFIGSPKMNFFPVKAVAGNQLDLLGGSMQIPWLKSAGEIAEVGVRPEHMAIAADNAPGLSGKVLAGEHLGSDTFAYFEVEGLERPVMVRLDGEHVIRHGTVARLAFEPSAVHLFDGGGQAIRPGAVQTASVPA